ncbi:MAG TPA: hypothetical protein PL193_04980, partial [Xanthobacteraceae bacterium]|nr:hypothetical protein [Xanthobacteraceae bacterium]
EPADMETLVGLYEQLEGQLEEAGFFQSPKRFPNGPAAHPQADCELSFRQLLAHLQLVAEDELEQLILHQLRQRLRLHNLQIVDR